jgi:hypothetical protein
VTAKAYLAKATNATAQAALCTTQSGRTAWLEVARQYRLLAAMAERLYD